MWRKAGKPAQALRARLLKFARSPWNLVVRGLVRAGRFDAASNVLARAAVQGVGRPPSTHRTVLLGGLGRIGKSTLAATLATRHGFRHIDLDYLVNRIYAVQDPAGRARLRSSFYHRLLSLAPVGHVIEGDDLVLADRWHGSPVFGQEPLDLGMLGGLARSFALPAFVVGSADADIEERLAILRQDDGWVTELSEVEMRAYVEFLMQGSAFFRKRAEEAGLIYLEVGGTDFGATIEALADQIEQAAR